MSRLAPLVALVALGAAGCIKGFPPEPTSQPTAAKADGKKDPAGAAKTPATAAASKAPPADDGHFSGAHILIAYQGAQRSSATRSKAEALALATKLAKGFGGKTTPEAFAAMARKHSDGPSGAQGGSLGTWKKGRMVPAFDKAIATLEFGAVTETPVETPFGYHVIVRYKVLPSVDLAAAQILIAYVGAMHAANTVTRDKASAEALCAKLAKLAVGKDAAAFGKLAEKHSDAADKTLGGRMGSWNARTSPLPGVINRAVHALEVGKTSSPVMSPLGCHVFLRLPVSAKK